MAVPRSLWYLVLLAVVGGSGFLLFAINKTLSSPGSYVERRLRLAQQRATDSVVEPGRKLRVVAFVKTSPESQHSSAFSVKTTWGKRIDTLLMVTSKKNISWMQPTIQMDPIPGPQGLIKIAVKVFDEVYKNYINEADWFLESDDDTYVIVENLRHFLSSQDTESPVYFGHSFNPVIPSCYLHGGSGYLLSKEALRRFGRRGPDQCGSLEAPIKDDYMGRCLETLGVKLGDSHDARGRLRFYCFDPMRHYRDVLPNWESVRENYGGKNGTDAVSNEAISFHYIPAASMREMEYFLYHIRPFNLNATRRRSNQSPSFAPSWTVTNSALICAIIARLLRKL